VNIRAYHVEIAKTPKELFIGLFALTAKDLFIHYVAWRYWSKSNKLKSYSLSRSV